MIVTRKLNNTEQDLLLGRENHILIITDIASDKIKNISAPTGGWTHSALEAIEYATTFPFGWDAYLGDKEHWIGSSEC